MALKSRTRFVLVESFTKNNIDDDEIEPYHTSFFRRTSSMPQLPRATRRKSLPTVCSNLVSKYQRREKDEALTNKLYKLNMHTMRKKSARIGMRLSTVFGLTSHVVDKNFHFEEQRFHSLEKFLRFFVRNAYTCMEGLKVR